MARPRLGSAAKAVVGSVRLNAVEAATLEADFGSVTKALRALVDAHLSAPKEAENSK